MEDLYFNVEDLETMARSDIQVLCKKFGIRANLKTDKMKEKLRKYHEEHLSGGAIARGDKNEETSEVEESSELEPSSVSVSEVETMEIVPEQREEESIIEDKQEETSAVQESEPASEIEEKAEEERSETKMEVESTTFAEATQAPTPMIEFPPYEAKTEVDPKVPVFVPYEHLQPASKAPMTPRSKKRVEDIRKKGEEKSKRKKTAILDQKRQHLAMIVDKISVLKRPTKPADLPKIDDSIDTPKKKSSLTWSEIEASAEANNIPLNEEDIDKFLERKKDRIQMQMLISKGPSMLQRAKPVGDFDDFVSHLAHPKEETIVKLAPGQTGFEFNVKTERVPVTPGATRGVQSKFGFSAVKSSFTSAATSAVTNAKVANTAKPAIKTQSKTGSKTAPVTKPKTTSTTDYVLGTKNLQNIKETAPVQSKPRASIATASSRVTSTVTKPVVAQTKIDSRRSLLPSALANKTVTKPVASRPSMVTKPVSRQSLLPSRPSTVTKPVTSTSKTAPALPVKSNIVKPITAASLKQQAAVKAAVQAEKKAAEVAPEKKTESAEIQKPEAKTEAPKAEATIAKAPTSKIVPRQSLIPKPTVTAKSTTSVTKPSTTSTTATKPITKTVPQVSTTTKAPLAAKSTTKPSIATLIKKRKLEDGSASGPAAKKMKIASSNNENVENMQSVAVSAPVGVSF